MTFSDDGNLVSFSDSFTNTFVPELSNGTLEDQITLVNLPYLKIVYNTESELNLLKVATVVAFPKVMEQLKVNFVDAIKAGAASQAIQRMLDSVTLRLLNGGRNSLLKKLGGACAFGRCQITLPSSDGVLGGIQGCSCSACNCSLQIVDIPGMQRLTNASDPFSFLNTSQSMGVNMWLSPSNANQTFLQTYFNLTSFQYLRYRTYLTNISTSDLIQTGVFSILNAQAGASNQFAVTGWQDLAYRQWLKADVISLLQKHTAFPQISVNPPTPPEFQFFLYSKYLNSSMGFNSTVVEDYGWSLATVACLDNVLAANQTFNLLHFLNFTRQRPGQMENFLRSSLNDRPLPAPLESCFASTSGDRSNELFINYFSYLANAVVLPKFQAALLLNDGILTTKSVREHALGSPQAMLQLTLSPDDPRYSSHAILQNDPSLDDEPLCRSTADMENDFSSCRLALGFIRFDDLGSFIRPLSDLDLRPMPDKFEA